MYTASAYDLGYCSARENLNERDKISKRNTVAVSTPWAKLVETLPYKSETLGTRA